MRKSLSTFIDTCFDVKVFLCVGSYELHPDDDGSFADFKVEKIVYPKQLSLIVKDHNYRILAGDGCLIVRVFENFKG